MEDKRSIRPPLLSDEEFTELMSAEYERQGQPVDQLASHRIWQRLEAAQSTPRSSMSRKWYAVAALISFFSLTPLLFTQWPQDDIWRPKGVGGAAVETPLSAYVLCADGNLTPLPEKVDAGTTIMFKVDLYRPAIVALALARNGQAPQLRFTTELEAGSQSVLAHNGVAYGYTIEHDDVSLRFCAQGSESRDGLNKLIKNLTNKWPELAANQCVELSIQ